MLLHKLVFGEWGGGGEGEGSGVGDLLPDLKCFFHNWTNDAIRVL